MLPSGCAETLVILKSSNASFRSKNVHTCCLAWKLQFSLMVIMMCHMIAADSEFAQIPCGYFRPNPRSAAIQQDSTWSDWLHKNWTQPDSDGALTRLDVKNLLGNNAMDDAEAKRFGHFLLSLYQCLKKKKSVDGRSRQGLYVHKDV